MSADSSMCFKGIRGVRVLKSRETATRHGRTLCRQSTFSNVVHFIMHMHVARQVFSSQLVAEDADDDGDAAWMNAQQRAGDSEPLVINIRSAFVAPPG